MSGSAVLERFLHGVIPAREGTALWRGGALRLCFRCYLDDRSPPEALVTNVRAVVMRGDEVLVLGARHILPGGRREPGESQAEALRRELIEETGWVIQPRQQLGFIHYHHLAARPDGHPYSYPDFLQVVYAARAVTFIPEAGRVGDWERAEFMPAAHVRAMPLPEQDRPFLEAAFYARDNSR